jgi:uncharacterized delta-60 repeat protein
VRAALGTARRSLLAVAALTAALAGPALAHPAPGDYVYPQGPTVMLDYKLTSESGTALALQPDGLVVVAGNRSQGAGPPVPPRAFVWRLWPWGTRDPGFGGGDGVVELEYNSSARGVVVQQDGKIVVAGNVGSDATVWRLEPDGSPDLGFGNGGKVMLASYTWSAAVGLALQADGGIVIAGHMWDPQFLWNWAAWRLDPDGAFDTSFGWTGQVMIDASAQEYTYAMTLQPDGKILIAGLQHNNSAANAMVLRLLPDGMVDRTFNNGGFARFSNNAFPTIDAIAMAPDGKIVLGGGTGWTGPGSTSDFDAYVARLRPDGGDGSIDGALDPSFNSVGIQPIPQLGTGVISGLAVEETGRIVAVGRLTHDQFYQTLRPHGAVYRINVDGTIDSGFWDLWNNPIDYRPIDELLGDTGLAAVAIAPNGNVIITGWNAPTQDRPGREGGVDSRALLITLRGGEATPQ